MTTVIQPLDSAAEARLLDEVRNAERFFMAQAAVHQALAKLARLLEEASISYALVGAMAMNEHGYQHVTTYVDLLLTADGLAEFKRLHPGAGLRREVRR